MSPEQSKALNLSVIHELDSITQADELAACFIVTVHKTKGTKFHFHVEGHYSLALLGQLVIAEGMLIRETEKVLANMELLANAPAEGTAQ